jgi:hypothetical protein
MKTFITTCQSQRNKETGEPDDATSITSGSVGGWGKRPEMDLARSLPSCLTGCESSRDNSMAAKREAKKGRTIADPQDLHDVVKAALPEAQFPVGTL